MVDDKPKHNQVDQNQLGQPTQIPLLEDVVNPAKVPARRTKVLQAKNEILDPLDRPLPTDLFGDPILSYAIEEKIDHDKLHNQASQVVDSLVEEYSHEFVRRLRTELTSVLTDLESDHATGATQDPEIKPPQPGK